MSERPGAARHALAPLFDPRSIAVIGASADPAKRGHQILRALGEAAFRGDVYPVNPKAGSLLGHRVYPSVASLPKGVDLAVLCTPAHSAPELIVECGARSVSAAIVLAVGFGESGPEGLALEKRLVEAARGGGVRILGPNTSGLLNLHSGANLIGARGVRPGGIALLVQSGNMALSLMNETTARTEDGVSICAGVGNASDVGLAEALDFLGAHHDTHGIIVYAEGLGDGRSFLEAASRVTEIKPVVMIKSARSERGAKAALSHTGAVAGAYDRLRAALRQVGVEEVTRSDELLHVAHTLSHQPALRVDTAVAILSDGGGQGTLAVDTLTELGVPLAEPTATTQQRLRSLLGPAAAVSNPVDVAGATDTNPAVFADALAILEADPGIGAVLLVGLFGGYGIRFAETLTPGETAAAREMASTMRVAEKAFVVHSMYASHRSAPLQTLRHAAVPVVESLETACRCVASLHRKGARTGRGAWVGRSPHRATRPEVMEAARLEGRLTLNEFEARTLLTTHGLRFSESIVAHDGGEVAAALLELGGPVALKVLSGHVVHKTDAGGVVLGIDEAAQAERAFDDLTRSVAAYAEKHGLPDEARPALVTRMARSPTAEILIGAVRDPVIGPVLTIGAGGIWVELLGDVAHRVLPIGRDDVLAMLSELRIARLLHGTRGSLGVDVHALVDAALAVADCILRVDEVAEIEINPMFAYATGVEPIDARVVLTQTGPPGA